MKLRPLGDKVVLKQLEADETTKSGIILAAGGVGKSMSESGLNRLAGISLVISGAGLFALGFATSDYPAVHDFATFVIFIFAIVAMVLATASSSLV